MTGQIIVAVPMTLLKGRAWMDHARPWSIVEEALLLALALRKGGETIGSLVAISDLPHQVIVASISRLMRFRLVEIAMDGKTATFAASPIGASLVSEGRRLPHSPREVSQGFSIGIEHVTNSCFNANGTRVVSRGALDSEKDLGAEVRILEPTDPDNLNPEPGGGRLHDLLEGDDRVFLRFAANETDRQPNRYMRLRVQGSQIRHFPRQGSPDLRERVLDAARGRTRKSLPTVAVAYGQEHPERYGPVTCDFDPADIVVGGPAQGGLLISIIEDAKSRLIIHSTFLRPERFIALSSTLRDAVIRGVTIDILWGAAEPGESHERTLADATRISALIREDVTMRGRVRMHMRTTKSHAKLLLSDRQDNSWIAVVSSCNWLSSEFQRIELSVVLRHPAAVADAIDLLRSLMPRRLFVGGFADGFPEELRVQANDLRRHALDIPPAAGDGSVTLMAGPAHDAMIRTASGAAVRRLVIGSDRLGSTAWTGAIIPGELVKERPGAAVTVLYRRPTGPVKNRHARELEREAAELGIRLVRTERMELHGKFVLWDDDDLIVTSLNWASASSDDQLPASEIGVHVRCPGIATKVMRDLEAALPEIFSAQEEMDNG